MTACCHIDRISSTMVGCSSCSLKIDTRDTVVQCDGCKGSLHIACTGLSKDEYTRVTRNKARALKIMCNNCDVNLNQLTNIKTLIQSEIAKLLAKITELENNIQSISNINNGTSSEVTSSQMENIIAELNERNIRKTNIILFNVNEQPSAMSKDQRFNKEKSEVSEIVKQVSSEVATENINFHRIGKFNDTNNRPRPIKVTLSNEPDVHKLIKNANKLKQSNKFKSISIAFDRTPRQISYYNELKEQLNARIDKGEQNLKIKYIQGVPKIINLN